jgi:glycosyltransferase involved in cell wall biosynthesis
MRILLTGRRGFDYNRVRVLLAGLEAVAPDQYEVFEFGDRTAENGKQLHELAKACDVIYVPPFRRLDVAFVRKHSADKPIVFDPLIGTYITRVVDDGYWWRGPYAKWRDRRDFRRADHLIWDTEAHRAWGVKTFNLDPSKSHTLYIGADTELFKPKALSSPEGDGPLTFGFYGSLAPLQGVETIMRASELLRHRADIRFEIIGPIEKKKKTAALRKKLSSEHISYSPYLPYEELQARIQGFDVGLGVFGTSLKADIVIPNKIYHYAALGLPIITRKTVGMEEQFSAGNDYVGTGTSPEVLAEAIVRLRENYSLRQNLGQAAYAKTKKVLSHTHVAKDFLGLMKKVINASR